MNLFPKGVDLSIPEQFTNPFRYLPHPLVRKAAEMVIQEIEGDTTLKHAFSEGKMLGILIVRDEDGTIGYLKGFSGNAGGESTIEGFVPPIYDLTCPGGYYRTKESEITSLTIQIKELKTSELSPCEQLLKEALLKSRKEIEERRLEIRRRKDERNASGTRNISESQRENAEFKRLKDKWKARIDELGSEVVKAKQKIESLKKQRAHMSEDLQKWIFSQYVVLNAEGRTATILEVFEKDGIIPPGGTGECAAPKLLNYAYSKKLTPIAMGEFWYGKSPDTAVRTQGHFYPSCTSKCGPLLKYMLTGLDIASDCPTAPDRQGNQNLSDTVHLIYEDEEIIVVSKPTGMPSVPGLDGRVSLTEILSDIEPDARKEIHPVHRLDMDTSGIMLFAKSEKSAIKLRKQFEEHTVKKTYIARLCPHEHEGHTIQLEDIAAKGRIELPLSPDYDERPRQKADITQGKPSLTEYEVIAHNEDGTIDVIFHPHTGRTHQLRVHSAHILGLGRPILGDLLYGGSSKGSSKGSSGKGSSSNRLHLHSQSISFNHPTSGELMTFSTDTNCF